MSLLDAPLPVDVETAAQKSMRVARPGEPNGDFVDRFTFVHAGYGWAMHGIGVPLGATLVGAVLFEIAEREMKRRSPESFPHPTQDTIQNQVGDVLAAAVGWYVSRRLRRR